MNETSPRLPPSLKGMPVEKEFPRAKSREEFQPQSPIEDPRLGAAKTPSSPLWGNDLLMNFFFP